MTYLIDTQILIWYQLFDKKLKSTVYDILTDDNNKILVSQVSLYEIAIKQKIGKMPEIQVSIEQLVQLIEKDSFEILALKNQHINQYYAIPLFDDHKDPFDRLILATSLSEQIPIISADENFKLYRDLIKLIEN
jgi:PIN domain nuclease of toxin-antitoxin system